MEAETTDLACGVDVAGVAAFECEHAVLEINIGHEANMRACYTSRHTSVSHGNVADMGNRIWRSISAPVRSDGSAVGRNPAGPLNY